MESSLTDPTPYITASFLIAAISLFGFSLWLIRDRRSLTKKLAFLESEDATKKEMN